MTLEVRSSNDSALHLYEKLGFKSVGRRRNYYEDGEDAEIMWITDLAKCTNAEVISMHQYLFFIGDFPIRAYGLVLSLSIILATGVAYFLAKQGRSLA